MKGIERVVRGLLPDVLFLMPPDPLRTQGYLDTAKALRPENDPESPPVKRPGDSWVLALALAGLVVGSTLGLVLALLLGGRSLWLLSTIAGGVIFGIAGAFAGDALKKRSARRLQHLS